MSRRPWMPFYVADYLAETTRLSPAEHGAYLLLMLDYWRNGGLPADPEQLARIVRMTSKDWTKVAPAIAALFGPAWTHARLDQELKKAAQISDARRAAAGHRKIRPLKVVQSNDQSFDPSIDRSKDQSFDHTLHTSHFTEGKEPVQEDETSEGRLGIAGEGSARIQDVFGAIGAA